MSPRPGAGVTKRGMPVLLCSKRTEIRLLLGWSCLCCQFLFRSENAMMANASLIVLTRFRLLFYEKNVAFVSKIIYICITKEIK
jgi:hypothetical protein